MEDSKARDGVHPEGELRVSWESYPPPRRLETVGGGVEVRWEEDSGVSMHGGLAYFIEFLNVSGIWKRFVAECPVKYSSPNAPSNSEILGTILFSVLSGHRRYAHITRIRGDDVLPGLLGIKTLRSEDSIRRAFEEPKEEDLTLWMDGQMNETLDQLVIFPPLDIHQATTYHPCNPWESQNKTKEHHQCDHYFSSSASSPWL